MASPKENKSVNITSRSSAPEEDPSKSNSRSKVNTSPPPPEHVVKRGVGVSSSITGSVVGLNMSAGEKELHKKYINEKEKNKDLEERLVEKEKLINQLKEYSKELAKNLDERERQLKKMCGGTSKAGNHRKKNFKFFK
jgi:uncharacterized protein HemX